MKKKDSLTKNSIIVFILTTFGSAINYLCQILMGRYYSISNYGIINTIFSLTLIVSVIGNTASMILSKTIAENKKNNSSLCYDILKIVTITCIIIFIISIFLSLLYNKVINWNYTTIILALISLLTAIYPIVYQGIFGGLNKFLSLGLYTLIIPIVKFLGLVLTIYLKLRGNYEIYMALLFIIIGNIISILIGHVILKKNIKNDNKKNDLKNVWKKYSDIFGSNIYMMILMNVDILYLGIFHTTEIIGLYSSVLIFGKMIYYFVTALVTVMLPLVSKNQKNSKYISEMLFKTLLYTFILTVLFLVPINIFGNNMLSIVFGDKYLKAFVYMKYASLISLSYSLNLVLLNYLVGIGKLKFMRNSLIFGTMCAIILLVLLNELKYTCLLLIFGINISIFIINLINILKTSRR